MHFVQHLLFLQAPPVVQAGEDEYMIIPTGVKDTGLSGKYWADMQELPARRRRSAQVATPPAAEKEKEQQKTSPAAAAKAGGGGRGKKKEESPTTTTTPATAGRKRGPKRKQAQSDEGEVLLCYFWVPVR